MTTYDVVIVGGSAMGSATAWHLRHLAPELSVAVVEKDPTYQWSSTLRSDGNLRVQFNLEENVRMSQYTFDLLDGFAEEMADGEWRPEPAPRHQGNLFLSDEDGRAAALSGIELQRSLGCDVEWLEPDEIAARWPALRSEGTVGGTFGPRDGAIDPSAVLEGFRRGALRRGATYLLDEAVAIATEGGRVVGVDLASGERLETGVVVNCAGGWATPLARSAGVEIPVEPFMRTVYVAETPLDITAAPSVFVPSGLYLLTEGTSTAQIAWSTAADEVGFDFTFRRAAFEEVVWPELIRWLPAFDQLKVTSGWCGIYDMNTLDHNAILGEWPTVTGYWMANGFSGHGFQHTPAMGRYLAELISGSDVTLDLSRLGPQRILDGVPVREHAGRII